ncbi:hypothetical protein [Burkholderia gladioli]|uniref:hypothetical protein n=1 Tax=Burkholderia gladioli TaxID=28095 RepID=UPI000301C614|nr:hypothetical protein [Burkholderia gladioli]MBW5288166.1 hypothetical protein [Burkholderia gladioli]
MSDFADILEETDWFKSDLQALLARLIKDGKVASLSVGVKRRTKRPLHFAQKGGETLKCIE